MQNYDTTGIYNSENNQQDNQLQENNIKESQECLVEDAFGPHINQSMSKQYSKEISKKLAKDESIKKQQLTALQPDYHKLKNTNNNRKYNDFNESSGAEEESFVIKRYKDNKVELNEGKKTRKREDKQEHKGLERLKKVELKAYIQQIGGIKKQDLEEFIQREAENIQTNQNLAISKNDAVERLRRLAKIQRQLAQTNLQRSQMLSTSQLPQQEFKMPNQKKPPLEETVGLLPLMSSEILQEIMGLKDKNILNKAQCRNTINLFNQELVIKQQQSITLQEQNRQTNQISDFLQRLKEYREKNEEMSLAELEKWQNEIIKLKDKNAVLGKGVENLREKINLLTTELNIKKQKNITLQVQNTKTNQTSDFLQNLKECNKKNEYNKNNKEIKNIENILKLCQQKLDCIPSLPKQDEGIITSSQEKQNQEQDTQGNQSWAGLFRNNNGSKNQGGRDF